MYYLKDDYFRFLEKTSFYNTRTNSKIFGKSTQKKLVGNLWYNEIF